MSTLSLPNYCYVNHPVTGEVVKIELGKQGYYETDCGTSAEEMNETINVKPQQAEAMLAGSMFGWNSPGADPNVYDKVLRIKGEVGYGTDCS